MKRFYLDVITENFKNNRQMIFLMGPRQVGKTTTSLSLDKMWQKVYYLSWDNSDHRHLILGGASRIAEFASLNSLAEEVPVIILDEIHKYKNWKILLKGLYDSYPSQAHILVTGSARLDVYKKGGDSLMGRYFYFRFHPLSIAELLHQNLPDDEIRKSPKHLDEDSFSRLWKFGGFPDPYLKGNLKFFNRWNRLRFQQLFNEDIRDLSRIQEIGQIEVLAEMMVERAGQHVSFSSLANELQCSDKTVRSWLKILKALYFTYELSPWSKNVSRSLIKEPKYYLWDWSLCRENGKRAENFIASHLLKAVHYWTDIGFGTYELHYLRDKNKREVDFIVTKNRQPWFLVEAKYSDNKGISPSLYYFQEQLKVPHAFQVVIDMPYVNKDCFSSNVPIIVPARTFLSQLV